MPKTKQQKEIIVNEYSAKLKETKTIIIFRPNGITANEASDLKKELFDITANFKVVKNTLLKISLKNAELPEFESLENRENAVVFCTEDNITDSAKIIKEFIQKAKKGEIVGGVLNGTMLSQDQVISLADLPAKDQLLGQLLNVFNGPARGFVTVLNGNIREFVYLLNALKDTKKA
ncbi:MAG: 50S ribosomal protein L10 [bacterium]